MPTLLGVVRPLQRNQAFVDIDGINSFVKHRDEKQKLRLDWDPDLVEYGDSISSVTNTSSGVTLSGAVNNATTTEVTVTGVGSLEVKVTTVLGRILVEQFRFYERNNAPRFKDYRG